MEIIIIIVPLLVSIAYITLAERKIMGSMQRRKGPEKVGLKGLLQPISDGLKLVLKETIFISESNKILFIVAPTLTLILSILLFIVIPYNKGIMLIEMTNSIIYVLLISSLGIICIILAGWSSNSKYSIIGTIRTTGQLVSYEIIIAIIVIEIIIIAESTNLSSIVEIQKNLWLVIPLSGISIIFVIGAIAETNRAPFDLTEAESELVSGFMTEHSSMSFAFFFLGEYASIIGMCTIISLLILGGYHIGKISSGIILGIKVAIIIYIFIWTRASMPRCRIDQIIKLMWEHILPIVLAYLIFEISILEITFIV